MGLEQSVEISVMMRTVGPFSKGFSPLGVLHLHTDTSKKKISFQKTHLLFNVALGRKPLRAKTANREHVRLLQAALVHPT